MKSMIKGCIMMALTVLATFSNAEEIEPSVNVNVTGRKMLSISLNEQFENIQTQLKNAKGQVIMHEDFEEGVSMISYDLNNLDISTLKLEVISDVKVQTIPVIVTEENVVLEMNNLTEFYFPVVFQKGDRVSVSKWAPQKEKMKIVILNEDNELVYEEQLLGERYIGKRFDFSYAESGVYEMKLACDYQVYTKSIAIE